MTEDKDNPKPTDGNIINFSDFFFSRRKKEADPSPAQQILQIEDDFIDYSALVTREQSEGEKLAESIKQLIPDDNRPVDLETLAASCSDIRDRIYQNQELLREPIVYNNLHVTFLRRRLHPPIRELFLEFCKLAPAEMLISNLNTAIVFASGLRSLSLAGEECVDLVKTILEARPELIENFAPQLKNAVSKEVLQNPMLDELANFSPQPVPPGTLSRMRAWLRNKIRHRQPT